MHLLLAQRLGSKLGQLDEYQVEAVDDLVCVLLVNHAVVMVVLGDALLEHVVDNVQGINRFEKRVVLPLAELPDVCLGRVECHPLQELGRPHHLHFYDKLPAARILTPYVYDAVLAQRVFGHHLGLEIDYRLYFLLRLCEGKECIEQTDHQVWMFAEYLLERKVCFGVKISCHVYCCLLDAAGGRTLCVHQLQEVLPLGYAKVRICTDTCKHALGLRTGRFASQGHVESWGGRVSCACG